MPLVMPFNRSSAERLLKLAIHVNPSNVALFVYNPVTHFALNITIYVYLEPLSLKKYTPNLESLFFTS